VGIEKLLQAQTPKQPASAVAWVSLDGEGQTRSARGWGGQAWRFKAGSILKLHRHPFHCGKTSMKPSLSDAGEAKPLPALLFKRSRFSVIS